jgi:predicted AlkP superfamily pyrophosphatase or phosphodiesterase
MMLARMHTTGRALLGLIGLAAAGASLLAQPADEASMAVPAPPRLVVILVIDQFRADYVQRYGHQWSRGLRRLFTEGAYYTEAAHRYASTMTCAGHATIGTGTFPQTHGLISNAWYDRAAGRDVACTEDASIVNVGYGPIPPRGGDSPARLATPSLADEMRAQLTLPPKIVTLSMKARSALPLAGHRSTLSTWFDGPRGFVTSPAMGTPERVPFLETYLQAHPVEADEEQVWDRLLPEAAYAYTDAGIGEAGMGGQFPHRLAPPRVDGQLDPIFYGNWQMSPFADAYIGRMAEAAVKAYGLGAGPATDFLAVSFSALDIVGHAYGPRSHEVQDVLARVDATIGQLLDALDRDVGRDRYVLALTADHGASPVPAQMIGLGLGGGVVDRRAVSAVVTEALGGSTVDSISGAEVYLSKDAASRLTNLDARAWDALRTAIEAVPGVAQAYRTTDLLAGRYQAADRIAHAMRLSAFAGRSGDILFVTEPYWFPYAIAATHGTPYAYDQRVPLVFFGQGIRPGRYTTASSPADVAPTLARLLGVTLPAADGSVRVEALAAPPGLPSPPPTRH